MSYGDVRDRLLELPHHHGGNGHLTHGNPPIYPPRYEIARITKPRRIFEFGALYGYALAAMILGSPRRKLDVGWVDNETHTPGSNDACAANIRSLGKTVTVIVNATDHEASRAFGQADVVLVDSDHTPDGCLRDLVYAWALNPGVILIDDWTATCHREAIQGAAYAFVDALGLPLAQVVTENGLAVIDRTRVGICEHLTVCGYETEQTRP